MELAELLLSLIQRRLKIHHYRMYMSSQRFRVFSQLRALENFVKAKLVTIHPNPGPHSRDKTEEGKERRRERRYEKRKEKRKQKKEAKEKQDEEKKKREEKHIRIAGIATWNVQRMSLGTRNRRKAKSVATYTSRQGWDATLLTEVRAEGNGKIWMGEEDERVVIVYAQRAAIMLRGRILDAWIEEGQLVKYSNRSIAVKAMNMILISTYQPVHRGNINLEVEQAKEELKILTKWADKDNVLIVGGDFNAHVGADEDRP